MGLMLNLLTSWTNDNLKLITNKEENYMFITFIFHYFICTQQHGLTKFVCFRLQHIRENIGPDAYEYLQFQQYLIIYILILMILSMVVILPINIYSENKSTYTYLKRNKFVNIKITEKVENKILC